MTHHLGEANEMMAVAVPDHLGEVSEMVAP